MGNAELAVIEHCVADETVDELSNFLAKLRCFRLESRHRLFEPVVQRDLASRKGANQLHVVIPWHAHGLTLGDGAHHKLQNTHGVRASIHEIADEHQLSTLRMFKSGLQDPAELRKKLPKLR